MGKEGELNPRRSKRKKGLEPSPVISSRKLNKNKQKEVLNPVIDETDAVDAEVEVNQEGEESSYNDDQEDERTDPIEEAPEPPAQEEDFGQPSTDRLTTASAETSTQVSVNTEKKIRGPTKLRRVAKSAEDKVDVEFTELGEFVGPGSVKLSSFLGALVREYVPVILDDWRQLDDILRDTLWEEIQGRFNLDQEWQRVEIFKHMGCLFRASKSNLLAKVRGAKSKTELLKLKPSNISSATVWNNWVKSRTSSSFKEQSDKFKHLRNCQIPHTTSRKGMIRLAHEMKKESSDPSQVTRSKVWVKGHTHSDGRPVKAEYVETIEKIKSIDSEMESTSTSVRDDAVSQVLGKDKPGRIRGLGRGATLTKLAFMQVRDSHVQKLEANQELLLSKVEDLQNVVKNMASNKALSHTQSKYEATDLTVGVRCQILDLESDDDIVIAEGEFCSSESTYKIGRVPLGHDAAAVVVKTVFAKQVSVWRPIPNVVFMGQALGVKIAWPVDKLILDNDDLTTWSTTANNNKKAAYTEPIRVQSVNNTMPPPQPPTRSTNSNVSINNSSSKGERQNCVLLDIEKPEKVVATGRVYC